MAKKYLDYDGLLYFWQKIKAKFNKADIAYDATNKKITKTIDGTTSDVVTAATLKTDMGLGSVAAGAEVNQNAFSNVKVGTTTVSADTKTDTLELVAGSNVTLTPDSTNDKVTIAAPGVTKDAFKVIQIMSDAESQIGAVEASESADTLTLVKGDNVSFSVDGDNKEITISATDTKYSIVGANGTTGLVKNGSTVTSTSGLTACPIISGVPYYKDTNNTYSNASLGQGYGTCSTAEATAAKVVTLSGYALTIGGVVSVKFTYNVPANATMNINSKGAKNIFYKGAKITAGVIKAGDVATFIYDGTQYHLISIDSLADNPKISVVTDGASGIEFAFGSNSYYCYLDTEVDALLSYKIGTSQKGAASGVCPLNASTKIDSKYLPSYVDDVIEVYARSGQTALSQNWLATGSASGTVVVPETGKIYILMADSGDYSANDQFRWSGTTYVKMADGGVSAITNAEIDTILAA